MMMRRKGSRILSLLVGMAIFFLVVIAGLPTGGYGQSRAIDPKAKQLLQKMSDYLAGLQQFSVQTENSLEVILRSGEKIQFGNPAEALVKRPNKMRADRKGDIVNQEFYYDGKALTLYTPAQKYYATVNAPPTLEEALDYARASLDIYAPAGDLLYKNAYKRLMQDVMSGLYIGMSVVGGVRCHHLSFRGREVDWQIWLEDGDKPLPRKYIVTSKWLTGAPQFVAFMNNWNLSPRVTDDMFTFAPPKDAQKIDFLLLTGGETFQR
jgi:hypothetical protein